jgi:hypothetical protein
MVYVALNPVELTDYDTASEWHKRQRKEISPDQVREMLGGEYVSCCHPEHTFVLHLIKQRFGIEVKIPTPPMKHRLCKGDKVIIVFLYNLARIPPTQGYTTEQMRKARITFLLHNITE